MTLPPIHESVTLERLLELADSDEYLGVCLRCGADRACCEPDAEAYACDEGCGPFAYGPDAAMLLVADEVPA